MHFIKYYLFLLSLIVLMLADPFLEELVYGTFVSMNLLTISAGLCIYVFSGNKKIFWIMITASILIVGFTYVSLLVSTPVMLAVRYFSLSFLFLAYASFLFYLLVTLKGISLTDISNAISVYLLIGIAFGFLYSFVELIHPGSIVYTISEGKDISGDMIYFSFVVLTTMGFGDILPVYKVAKVIVMMESVLGVLYIAVMIGRLVGINPARSNKNQQ